MSAKGDIIKVAQHRELHVLPGPRSFCPAIAGVRAAAPTPPESAHTPGKAPQKRSDNELCGCRAQVVALQAMRHPAILRRMRFGLRHGLALRKPQVCSAALRTPGPLSLFS